MEQSMIFKRLLEVKNLKVSFFVGGVEFHAVNDVSYYVDKGEVVAIVGESGCGKSVTQMSVMQLIQTPPGKILGGEVWFEGKNLLQYGASSKEMEAIRGNKISMIFQEPMTSLNPVFTIGQQFCDIIRKHRGVSKKEAWRIGTAALETVGIPDPAIRMKNYPFEMSGGMRQRALIALSVACDSQLIIADEPTTALDVTIQAQVMELLMDIKRKQDTSLIVVTHNLGLVSRYADRIYVMYAGSIVESGTTEDILTRPYHPYTRGLLRAVPRLEDDKDEALVPIEGAPLSLAHLPECCAFSPRCTCKCEHKEMPVLKHVGEHEHYAACWCDFTEGHNA